MKSEIWFEWERQATVHPIRMCMNAWMEPMEKAYGRPWPRTVIIYNGEIVSWYNLWADLLDYGQYLINIFVEESEQKKLLNNVEAQATELRKMFSKFDSIDLHKVTDNELLSTYEELNKKYVGWFVPGGLVEPIGHRGERLVRELLSSLPESEKNELFSLITTTTHESFSKRELHDLLEIAIAKKHGNFTPSLLTKHAKKYFWLHNNYFSTEVLDEKFFEKELENALSTYPDPAGQIEKMDAELRSVAGKKAELVKKLQLNQKNQNLIKLLDLFAWYQDYRKEYTMQMLHYLDLILAEIGKRNGLSLNDMKYSFPSEVLAGRLDGRILKERKKRYLFHFDQSNVIDGVGDWSKEEEERIFKSTGHRDEVLELTGMVANKGFVRGRARVTMSISEAKHIQPGEILITSMTTPDFVTAIKRAAAIVTNEGGILCHAAVVSREFGIPCMVGTKLATKVFKTGDLLEVDCELGVVRKISE
ncbi:Phosphoenolpyruvate synthase [Candidatus Bilamarchaeum dharawalense]|uniref:Phosphoenolpyruvate synthase n=1 Tax=Candidatus Bilamarchaeum dharawalense TaxID=2885759 RepID=A0A5E4LPS1_9ARCH|nr:Phosphoenolpyruvate synthase [Candidatus Bilamarchaeum dharawalense]